MRLLTPGADTAAVAAQVAPAPESGGDGPASRRVDGRTIALHASVIGSFLAVSIVMWWRVWITGHPTSTMPCQCVDASEELSYLAWMPWAIAHGHNPFFTNALLAGQGGANMLINTSFMAGATLFAPITWLFGPVATFNLAATLAPVVSGWCFFLAVRACTRFVPGQVLGAALYGFSPIIVTNSPEGHFFTLWLFYPPLAFLCLYDLFVTRRHRPWRVGLALGALTAVQFFTGTEVLVITFLGVAIGSVLALIVAPRVAWQWRRHVIVGLGVGGALSVVLLAYPAWYALGGPRHIVGAAWPLTPYWGIKPSSVLSPGPYHFRPPFGYFGPGGPFPSYLGFGVLGFVGISVFVWRRIRLAWVLCALGFSAWLLSLGSHLVGTPGLGGAWWLPWRFLLHLPVVSQVIPGRMALVTLFCAAMLLAMSADAWWRWLASRSRHGGAPGAGSRGLEAWQGAGVAALSAIALVPLALTYSFPFVVRASPTPKWFTTVATKVPVGTELLVYPYPEGLTSQSMGWQAMDDFRFRMVGGFLIIPGQDGTHSMAASPFTGPRPTLDQLSIPFDGALPGAAPSVVDPVREALARWHADDVVVTSEGRDPEYAVGFFTAVLGRMPRFQAGSWVWYGLGHEPPLRLASTAISDCIGTPSPSWGDPSVVRCVLRAGGRS